MKRNILIFLLFSLALNLFSIEMPELLKGIYEGKDRYVLIDENDDKEELTICLKEYYGWYTDRTAEPEIYKSNPERTRNAGTTKEPVIIDLQVNNILAQSDNLLCAELKLVYSNFQNSYVPVCIYKNNMYLNFYVQNKNDNHFYVGNAVSKGIMVSEQAVPENISCLYIKDDSIYDIRYWKTDMDYSEDQVTFALNDVSFYVPRHIISGNQIYACVEGRRKKINNPQPPKIININDLKFSEDGSVLIYDEAPYLTKLTDNKTRDDLINLLKIDNSRIHGN